MSETKFATVGGITLHYRREGTKAGVPLVFINSLGTDLRIWDRLVSDFAGRFAVVRYDKRGHGLSDCPPEPYAIGDHSSDLMNLLAYLGLEQVILVGISVGGMIALNLAIRQPERVRALVLSDTAAKIGTADYWNERINAIREKGMDHLAEVILSRWFTPEFSVQRPADYQGYRNMLVRTPVAGYTGTCAAIRDADLRDDAGAIRAKTLVLCGAEDSATPPGLVRGLADALPAGRFELIEKAGHLPCVEQPEAMAAEIDRFLREIP
jgi:3-oxoadipate enol-lactonase